MIDLLQEWDQEANAPLTPDTVSYSSHLRVWWRCQDCQHRYRAVVSNRTRKNKPQGCPRCTCEPRRGAIEASPVTDQINWIRFESMSAASRGLLNAPSPSAIRNAVQRLRIDGGRRVCGGYVMRYALDIKKSVN